MTTTIAVASGKGGVGKTTIAVNLSLSLALQNKETLLLDADLGMANSHILLGINPKFTLDDFVTGRSSIDNVITITKDKLKFILFFLPLFPCLCFEFHFSISSYSFDSGGVTYH